MLDCNEEDDQLQSHVSNMTQTGFATLARYGMRANLDVTALDLGSPKRRPANQDAIWAAENGMDVEGDGWRASSSSGVSGITARNKWARGTAKARALPRSNHNA
jgi:hypothetical protein